MFVGVSGLCALKKFYNSRNVNNFHSDKSSCVRSALKPYCRMTNKHLTFAVQCENLYDSVVVGC